MDSLIQDTLDYLKEVAKTTPYLFATQEEVDYFTPRQSKPKPIVTSSPLPLPKKRVEAPAAPQKVEFPPTPPPKPPVIVEKKQLNEMRLVIEKTFPELALRETILDDAHAKKMSRLWEETYLSAQIVVIAFGEVGAGLDFLKNVVDAIDRLIAPAELIDGAALEKEQGWDLLLKSPSLKGVLCSPWSSWKSTSLSKYYKQNGATQEQFLGSQKLLLLEPSLSYLKNPDRKRKLWQLINTQLLS
ncbi:MAG: hypothetical protein KBA81_02555 [Rhabdochlamydiaceae bacterium]|nr:hypothetical protein [Rhabdochlamydiaceae bacterium]